MKPDRISFTCTTHGYCTTTEQDVELPSIYVTVWTAQGSVGKAHELECHTPQELWNFIRAMNKNRAKTLLQTFNYVEVQRSTNLPINLEDLFL